MSRYPIRQIIGPTPQILRRVGRSPRTQRRCGLFQHQRRGSHIEADRVGDRPSESEFVMVGGQRPLQEAAVSVAWLLECPKVYHVQLMTHVQHVQRHCAFNDDQPCRLQLAIVVVTLYAHGFQGSGMIVLASGCIGPPQMPVAWAVMLGRTV